MEILTVGSAMIDTIAIIDSNRIERMSVLNADSSFLLLEEGRKTEAEEISTHPGGGAVNAAVAKARLEMDVSLLAKLGTDARAEAFLARHHPHAQGPVRMTALWWQTGVIYQIYPAPFRTRTATA